MQDAAGKSWGRGETADCWHGWQRPVRRLIAVDFIFSTDCDPADAANAALTQRDSRRARRSRVSGCRHSKHHPVPVPPLAVRRPVAIPDLWFIDGAEASCPFLQQAARSSAAAFLVGDEDARIRRVQAFRSSATTPIRRSGIEAARLEQGDHTAILGGAARLASTRRPPDRPRRGRQPSVCRQPHWGDRRRGRCRPATSWPERSKLRALPGKLVFIGSSLPSLGGLRPTASMPLQPSVQIHADIANAVLTGFIPRREPAAAFRSGDRALTGGLLLCVLATRLKPVISALLGISADFRDDRRALPRPMPRPPCSSTGSGSALCSFSCSA